MLAVLERGEWLVRDSLLRNDGSVSNGD